MAKRKKTRKPGRPRKKARIITLEKRELAADLILKGRPLREIAKLLDVDESTVRYHLEHWIEPAWRENSRERRDREMAKVDLLERTAWLCFEKSQKPQTRRQIKQALTEAGGDPQIIERVLTKTTRVGEATWVDVIQWCIDWRAKMHGSYAAEKHEHAMAGEEFRVAGRPRLEILAEIGKRLSQAEANGNGDGGQGQ